MAMGWSKVKEIIRTPAVKIVTRLVVYGVAAVCTKLGLDAAMDEEQSVPVAEFVVAAVFALIGMGIDRWHHGKDTARDE